VRGPKRWPPLGRRSWRAAAARVSGATHAGGPVIVLSPNDAGFLLILDEKARKIGAEYAAAAGKRA